MGTVIAIDAGTTGVRSRAVHEDGRETVASYREFTQHYPQPGWVEHDAEEIWQAVKATLLDVIGRLEGTDIAAIGITNQRETVVAWSRTTGRPLHRAIVWQDRRTADRCDALADRRPPRARSLPHRPRPRPVLLRHEDGLAVGGGRRAGRRRPRAGHDRRLDPVEPDRRRGLRHRSVERQPDDAVRHPLARVERRAVRVARRTAGRLAGRAAVEWAVRPHVGALRCARRHPGLRYRRRPAGGAVRPGLLRAGDGQEHLRHRQLRADERRFDAAPCPRKAC